MKPAAPARFVLASSSAARLRVLRDAGIDPEVVVSGVDETTDSGLDTPSAAAVLAERKAAAVAARCPDALVLGCDSLLDLGGEALGKPGTAERATALWARLSGREATLCTGHCLIETGSGHRVREVGRTLVRFGRPGEAEIAAYVASGEPLGLAGGFSLEGRGGVFVEGVEGDPSNVLGLSLPLLRRMLATLGVAVTSLWRPPGNPLR